jgi:hypothetical protein
MEMGDFARSVVRATGFDQVGQLAGGVVVIALMTSVEADLIGETVGDVVGELGGLVVFIDQAGKSPGRIILIAQPMAIGVDALDGVAVAVVDPAGEGAQGVGVGQESSFWAPLAGRRLRRRSG